MRLNDQGATTLAGDDKTSVRASKAILEGIGKVDV